MAQTQAATKDKAAPPPPPPPANGTPAPELAAKAPMFEEGALSDPFRKVLPEFSAEEWERHVIYLYRLGPITDRTGAGRAKNLMKYCEAIDEDRIMKEFGSGRYRADCVRLGPKGKNVYVFQHTFEILNPDYPPKIPAGDWVDDPRNKEWEWCRQIPAPGAAGGPTADQLADAAIKLIRETKPALAPEQQNSLANQIVGVLKDNQEQMRAFMDPTKQISVLSSLLTLLPKPGPDTAADRLITMLMDDRKAMRQELSEMRQLLNERSKEKPLLEQLTDLEPLIDRLSGGRRRNTGEEENGWIELGKQALDKLGPPIGQIAQYLVMRPKAPAPIVNATAQPLNAVERRKGHAAQQPIGAPATTSVTAMSPQAPPIPAQEAGPEAPAAVSGNAGFQPAVSMTQEEQNAVMGLYMEFGQLIASCAPILVDHFQNSLDGYEFRDWFLSRKGLECWNAVRARVGVDNLVNFAKYDAGLWNALQPEAKFRQFLEEFFTPVGEEEETLDEADGASGAEAV